MKKNIRTNAVQVLNEQYKKEANTEMFFAEFVELSADSDPGFIRWLFDEELDADFDSALTEEHKAEWATFLSSIA